MTEDIEQPMEVEKIKAGDLVADSISAEVVRPCAVCGLAHEHDMMLAKRIIFENSKGETIREVVVVKCMFCAEQDTDFTLVQP